MKDDNIIFIPAILFICFAVIVTFIGNSVYAKPENILEIAVQEIIHDSKKKILVTIGNKSHTRISFPPYAIREVVGDKNKFKIIHDSQGTNIFVLPTASKGEKLNLTVISSGGKTQDLTLQIQEGEGSVIYIKGNGLENENQNVSKLKFEEAKLMLKAMRDSKKEKYDVTDLKTYSQIKSKSKNISIDILNEQGEVDKALDVKEETLYSYKSSKLKGIVLKIVNKTTKAEQINEEAISSLFSGTILASLTQNIVPSKGSIYAYVVLDSHEEQ